MFIGSDEAEVILNGFNLTGLTDVSFSSTINEEAVVLLANRGINRKINKGHVITCSINKLIWARIGCKNLLELPICLVSFNLVQEL